MFAIEKRIWLCFLIIATAAFAFMPLRYALGIFLGGAVSIVNFRLLSKTLKNLCSSPKKSRVKWILGATYLRIFFVGMLLYLIISHNVANIFALTFGLSIVVFTLIGSIFFYPKSIT